MPGSHRVHRQPQQHQSLGSEFLRLVQDGQLAWLAGDLADSRSAAICASAAWPSAPPPANGSTMASHSSSASGPSCRLIFIKRAHHPGQTTHCKAARFFWETEQAQQRPPNALGQAGESTQLVVLLPLVLRYREGIDYEEEFERRGRVDLPAWPALLCRQLAAGLEIVTIAGVEGDVEFFASVFSSARS